MSAAKAAFHRNSEWRLLDASQRGRILSKFADLVERDAEYLADLESYNNGMICAFIRTVMPGVCGQIRYIASLADKVEGSTIPLGNTVIFRFNDFHIELLNRCLFNIWSIKL